MSAPDGFFIHYADPGFPEAPWPGERRLGPFLTLSEARAQAVADAAGGAGVALGVWSDADSEARSSGIAVDAEVTAEDVAADAAAERERLSAVARERLAEDRAAVEQMLPDGLTLADVAALLRLEER